ncbi:MAG: hypothetical protein NVS3B13_39090 [Mucilaginibacter sp.]
MKIFDIFNKGNDGDIPRDVKSIRNELIQFIKNELQKLEGGEGEHINSLTLTFHQVGDQKYLYERAIYINDPDKFKNEIRRIADDYALNLPPSWSIKFYFSDEIPENSCRIPNLNASLLIQTNEIILTGPPNAFIRIITGEAERNEYVINSTDGRIDIGRDKEVNANNGFIRKNSISFPGNSANDCNKFISRQHAHIEWDNGKLAFLIYADEGGTPPRNKTRVLPSTEKNPIKLNAIDIGYPLKEGDRVILGESAVIEFSYTKADLDE